MIGINLPGGTVFGGEVMKKTGRTGILRSCRICAVLRTFRAVLSWLIMQPGTAREFPNAVILKRDLH